MKQLDEPDKMLLHRAIEQLTAANAIMRFVSDYFRDKYHLTPDNQITPDGEIVDANTNGIAALLNAEGISDSIG